MMTMRKAEALVQCYGFSDVDEFADSLPEGAKVLDAGAGASTFGHTVAVIRPDVQWTNFDIGYHNKDVVSALSEDAPDNLDFVAGDMAELTQHIEPGSQDRTFTFWALAYTEDIRNCVRNLLQVTKTDGLFSAGLLLVEGEEEAQTIEVAPTTSKQRQHLIIEHIGGSILGALDSWGNSQIIDARYSSVTPDLLDTHCFKPKT